MGEATHVLIASQAQAADESVVDGVRAAAGAVDVGEGASDALAAATDALVAAVAGEAVAGATRRGRPHLTDEEKATREAKNIKVVKCKKEAAPAR